MRSVRFVLLSGAGWLLDMVLFWIGVSALQLSPGIANLLSATIAAMSVYIVSRSLVFGVAGAGSRRSLLIYWVYTEINIVLWAAAIEFLAGLLSGPIVPDYAALLAKVLVTPFSLGCNFLVARWLSERA